MKLVQIERDALLETAAGGNRHRGKAPYAADPLQRADRAHRRTAEPRGDRPGDPGLDELRGRERPPARTRASPCRRASSRTSCARCPKARSVALDAQNNRLQVRAGKSRFNLQTLPANDFPRLGDAGAALGKVTLPQKAFRELLLLVQYSMAQQDIRYYLNGLLLVLDEGQLKVVATDGHRLSYAARPLGQQQDKREVILPRKAVLELSKLLADSDEPVEIEIYASQVRFAFGDIVARRPRSSTASFPDYTRVIPSELPEALRDRPHAAAAVAAARRDPVEREIPRRALDGYGQQPADFVHEQRAGRSAGGAGDQLSRRRASTSVSTSPICSTCSPTCTASRSSAPSATRTAAC